MAIDVHAHLGALGRRQAAVSDLLQHARRCGIDRVLVSNLDAGSAPPPAGDLCETEANLATLRECARQPLLAPLYWARPGRVDSHVLAFAGALASEAFAGALFAPSANEFDADDELLDPYIAMLARLRLAAVFVATRDERAAPVRVYNLARRHPHVAFVICDAAADTQIREALDVATRAAERNDARLYLDTSHASWEELSAMLRAVGPERVLFGSDAPSASSKDADALALLTRMRDRLDPADLTKICRTNAEALFRLAPPEPNAAPVRAASAPKSIVTS